eukprot:6492001-Amphidinium_carterae.3
MVLEGVAKSKYFHGQGAQILDMFASAASLNLVTHYSCLLHTAVMDIGWALVHLLSLVLWQKPLQEEGTQVKDECATGLSLGKHVWRSWFPSCPCMRNSTTPNCTSSNAAHDV